MNVREKDLKSTENVFGVAEEMKEEEESF